MGIQEDWSSGKVGTKRERRMFCGKRWIGEGRGEQRAMAMASLELGASFERTNERTNERVEQHRRPRRWCSGKAKGEGEGQGPRPPGALVSLFTTASAAAGGSRDRHTLTL